MALVEIVRFSAGGQVPDAQAAAVLVSQRGQIAAIRHEREGVDVGTVKDLEGVPLLAHRTECLQKKTVSGNARRDPA